MGESFTVTSGSAPAPSGASSDASLDEPVDVSARAPLWRAAADGAGRVPEAALESLAARHGLSLLEAQTEACAAGCMPVRYARNARTLSPADQAMLLRSRVLLVGLGGLGGHVLDMLTRMGVGRITGVDGDIFEESNANRQLLATRESMGRPKVWAAARHVAAVNPAVRFTGVQRYVRGAAFGPLAAQADVVVDALGGLADRAALHTAAASAGKPVVCAGIAGLTGWVAVVRPGEADPMDFMQEVPTGASAEESLGNLAPTAALAASLQCAEILKLLAGRKALQGLIIFDLHDMDMVRVAL